MSTITITPNGRPLRGRIRFARYDGEGSPVDARVSGEPVTVAVPSGYMWVGELWSSGGNYLTLITGDVDYDALPDIDPATLAPSAEPEAAWTLALGELQDSAVTSVGVRVIELVTVLPPIEDQLPNHLYLVIPTL